MQNPENGSADGEVSGSLRDLRTEEEKLQRYADAVEWFIDHPEAMRDDPLLERFIIWIKELGPAIYLLFSGKLYQITGTTH